VSEEPINQSGKHDQDLTGHEDKRSLADPASSPSWQPLEPKPESDEDLVSILQAEFENQRNGAIDDHRLISVPSHSPSLQPDHAPEQPVTPYDQETDLAALAATVFDTTFYLVPRLNEHFLFGELAQHLRVWMTEVCDLYGWELNLLSIRPDYLKWTLLDFPECLTQKMLAAVRQWTSTRIFNLFPDMQAGLADLDFWSPGYLVDTLNRDFPTQALLAQVSRNQS
jgi:REP element-mobilizing transposase RayT